ncbi:MAG TPA: SDR family oxidoreductase [Pyrinomonadaceae bacterium]|nr:SDR family oxidoreductase [Pyrinomonadaceae bacterium]
MKILIFGGSGMLGHKLVQRLGPDFDVWTTLRGSFESVSRFGIFDQIKTTEAVNVEDEGLVRQTIDRIRPDVVINAVGIIKQLPSSKDVITTLNVNSIFPHRLAQLSEQFGFRLICVSTDCVFDGLKGGYTEADMPNAIDLYGKSKNLGEVTGENCLTIRTSIIGRELASSHSLVEWFLSNRGKRVKGFARAIYSGFPTIVLADIIRMLLTEHKHLAGLYHISSDPINKFELLKLIGSAYDSEVAIERDEDFRIDRSLDSSRFRKETGFVPKSWPEMIEFMAADKTPYDEWK